MATKKKTTSKAKTKKPAVKKSPVNKTTKSASVNKATSKKFNVSSFRRWNIILAMLFVAQAAVIIIIGKAYTLPVVTNYLSPDSLASQSAGHTVLAPAVHQLFSIDIRYIIMAYLLVAAIGYAVIATVKRLQYEEGLSQRVNKYRWLNYGISSAIMFSLIALLNGAYDSALLLSVVVLVGLLHFLGYFGEAKVTDMKAKLQTFGALCVAGATVWLIIGMFLKGAIFYGSGLSNYVYWIDGVIFVITLALALNKLQTTRVKGRWADYMFSERMFMILSFLGITSLTWLVFAGFLK